MPSPPSHSPPDLEDDDAPRRSRTDDKKQRVATETALAQLAERLLTATPRMLEALELDDDALSAVSDAKRIESAPARGRALRRVRSTLRGTDWVTLLRRLDALAGGLSPASLSDSEAARHAARLSAEGDPGLSRFLAEFPHADRARLRQLVQNVRRAPEAKREKVRRQLESLIQVTLDERALGSTGSESPHEP